MASHVNNPQQYGTICWLEIPVLSVTRAASFYTVLFNWDCQPLGPTSPSSSSSSCSSGGPVENQSSSPHHKSLLPPLPPPPPGTIQMFRSQNNHLRGVFIQVHEECLVRAWDVDSPSKMAVLTTFLVGDIEETLAKVVGMGGRVHLFKTAIGGDMGYFARFIDCEGNLQGIWAHG